MISVIFALLLTQSPPPPCSTPEYRQFDFWVGEWEVRGPKGAVAGINRITRVENGCALEENWKGAGGFTGRSINAYRASTRTWHQTWVGSDGLVLLLDGRYDAGKMVLEGTTGKTMHRITWSRLEGAKVRQLWEQSDDQGKTWSVAFDGTYSPVSPSKE